MHLHDVVVRPSLRFELVVPSLTIGPGITMLDGANGSGKSTLLRVLATVCGPGPGRLTVAGRSTDDPAALVSVRRTLGYLPQYDTVPPRLRVFDHVDVVAVMRVLSPSARVRRAMVQRALAVVGLADLACERCGRLSGGQRRRVALAAAMAGRPSLMVLDEPDVSLDDTQLTALAADLRARAADATIVIASHRSSWATALLPHRTLHLDAGRISG